MLHQLFSQACLAWTDDYLIAVVTHPSPLNHNPAQTIPQRDHLRHQCHLRFP
jgi:hypothetical protein